MPWRKPSANFVAKLKEKNEKSTYDIPTGTDDDTLNKRAYAVLVSEIMLQQTQVATVINYFIKWMKEFPTIEDLAKAAPERVNEMWAGLGYYRRAKFLQQCAKAVVEKHNGIIPKTAKELETLPGIGKYTAGAIASIAFGEVTPIVDGNVIRVLTRVRGLAVDAKNTNLQKLLWKLSGQIVDESRPGDFNQSLMELGATVCTQHQPQCSSCPIRPYCSAHKEVVDIQGPSKGVKVEDADLCKLCTNFEKTLAVTKYPIKSEKKKPRDDTVAVCVLQRSGDEEEFLLVQRPSTGLLASFWEFPTIELITNGGKSEENEDDEEEEDAKGSKSKAIVEYKEWKDKMFDFMKKNLKLSITEQHERRYVGDTQHLFSHIKQTILVEHLKYKHDGKETSFIDKPLMKWVKESEFETLAVAKGMKKCLALVKKNADGKKGGTKKSTSSPPKKKQKVENSTKGMQTLDMMFKKQAKK
jgi:A/G-specific adenine glycosylase